jgi:hypothetical protein
MSYGVINYPSNGLLKMTTYSVTRLGEISPIGRLFTVGRNIENYRSGPNFALPFFRVKITY